MPDKKLNFKQQVGRVMLSSTLDINITTSESISPFKSRLLSFVRPVQNNIYKIFDPEGLEFLTRLPVDLSHLNAHRYHYNLQECLNPLCSYSLETEDTTHYLLHCHYFSNQRSDLKNSVNSVVQNFEFMPENKKKIYFCLVTHNLIKTKIKLF